jgi:hypothetical protein
MGQQAYITGNMKMTVDHSDHLRYQYTGRRAQIDQKLVTKGSRNGQSFATSIP